MIVQRGLQGVKPLTGEAAAASAPAGAAAGPSLPLEKYAGVYRDPWYGTVTITGAAAREVMISAEMLAAYRATRYLIELPRRHIDLRIGRRSPAVDRLLAREGARGGAFLTAFNPQSERRSAAWNARALRALESDI